MLPAIYNTPLSNNIPLAPTTPVTDEAIDKAELLSTFTK